MKCLYLLALFTISCGTNPLLYTAEAVTEKALHSVLDKKLKPLHENLEKRLNSLEELIRSQQTSINLIVRSQRDSNLKMHKWRTINDARHTKVERYLAKMNGKIFKREGNDEK